MLRFLIIRYEINKNIYTQVNCHLSADQTSFPTFTLVLLIFIQLNPSCAIVTDNGEDAIRIENHDSLTCRRCLFVNLKDRQAVGSTSSALFAYWFRCIQWKLEMYQKALSNKHTRSILTRDVIKSPTQKCTMVSC